MEYVQEHVATLHDFSAVDSSTPADRSVGVDPSAPIDRATVVVPMTGREHGSPAAEQVLSTLARLDPGRVLVALRADQRHIADVVSWIESFDLSTTILWCTAPRVEQRLDEEGLGGDAGKGRDVWLGLGVASSSEYVVVHDADATSYDETHVPRLLFPLARDYAFVKGYYARVENDRLYGRLFRLFYVPLLRAIAAESDGGTGDLLAYLSAFRYALAGEFAMTGELAKRLRAPRGWGLEVGTLADAFDAAGFADTAQVDLGVHEHDHRAVDGPDGLGEMCGQVGTTLCTVLEEHGIDPAYRTLPDRYRSCARDLIEQYATDAAFNGLEYDRRQEREQVEQYATTIRPPARDTRLPAWRDADIDPATIEALSATAIDERTTRRAAQCGSRPNSSR